jgi:Zn-dependent oligopeptidase
LPAHQPFAARFFLIRLSDRGNLFGRSSVARKFKEFILSKGGTEHPMDLYKKFRGREPDPNALLRRDGLI